jgi:hypothetical protein
VGRVSVDLGALEAYCVRAEEQTAVWEPEREPLRVALEGLATALGAVPAEFNASLTTTIAAELAERYDQFVAEQTHLDDYVAEVHDRVEAADQALDVDTVNHHGVVTAPAAVLDGLSPTRYETAREEAAPDAHHGLELLTAAGVIDALDGGLQTDELVDIAQGIDSDGELAAWLEEVGPKLDDPLYAAAFYNALGPDGIDALAALFLAAGGVAEINNGAGWAQDSFGPGGGEWIHHVADPFIDGLADATRTGHLDLTHFTSLLDFETENDRYAAAILFSAEGDRYDAWTLGRIAQNILGPGHQYDDPDPFLTEADALMMRALAENPAAAYWFVVDDLGEPLDTYINILIDGDRDFSHLHAHEQGYNLENIWFDTIPIGLLPEMYNLWAATAAYSLTPDLVTYEYRDFNGNAIDGHPWRNPDHVLGDPSFLTDYDGWYDPTTGEHDTLYTIWVAAPGDELQPLVFYDEYRHHQFSLMVDMLPFAGQAKALYETITGEDPLTGEEVNRWLAGISFVLGAGLWTTSALTGGSPFVNALKTSLRNNPPIPRITAHASMGLPQEFGIDRFGIGSSRNDTYLMEIEGERYIFKPLNRNDISRYGQDMQPINEVAAYKLDAFIEFDLVPPTFLYHVPEHRAPGVLYEDAIGSLQLWGGRPKVPGEEFSYPEQERMVVFDYIIGNPDRHTDNLLVGENGQLVLIDNGVAFPDPNIPGPAIDHGNYGFSRGSGVPLSDDVLNKLWYIDLVELVSVLRTTGLSDGAVNGVIDRIHLVRANGMIP